MTGNCIKIDLGASTVCIKEDNRIYATVANPITEEIKVMLLDPVTNDATEIASFKGSRSYLIRSIDGRIILGVDNKLFATGSNGRWKTVLRTRQASNFFWHLTSSKDGTIYVQEYGEPPTGIYRSTDSERWDLVVTSSVIDKNARHFHSIAYDRYRDQLIATLGDANRVRICVSRDDGENWEPVYGGLWQVLPIVVLKDQVVFGMDSGIARGGLILWFPKKHQFKTLFLRWTNADKHRIRLMQMADLALLENDIWVAALGTPQAIIASTTLEEWYPTHIEEFEDSFSHSMSIAEGKNTVYFTTGKNVIFINKRDLAESFNNKTPVVCGETLPMRLRNMGHAIIRKITRSDI